MKNGSAVRPVGPVGRLGLLAVLSVPFVGAGCATPPKPPELEALEKLRQDPGIGAAEKRSPDLVGSADGFFERANKHWQDNDLYEARRDALMGQIKLKTALAISEQEQAKVRVDSANAEMAKAEEEYARLSKDLQAVNEEVALLKRLKEERAMAEAERQKLAQQLSAEQQKSAAEKAKLAQELSTEQQKSAAADKLKAAELALKTADTVEASSYAHAQYAAASDMLARAQREFGDGSYAAVPTSADLARQKADEATAVARPLYEQAGQAAANRGRDEALARDAAGIYGITVRLERRGEVQRLVLPLEDMFQRKSTAVASGKEPLLDAVALLLKKYPTYPVQVIGYTDNRGKAENLIALSLGRAQSIFSALVARGGDPKRMMVSGQGPAEPVSDNRSPAGRTRNNRVEVVFLYH